LPGNDSSRRYPSVIESPKNTTRFSPAAGSRSAALASRYRPSWPKSSVNIAILDQDALITAPDGTSREVHYKAGEFRWAVSTPGVDRSSQSAHREENLSDEPFESIRIEPKRAR
jgi:hypothetical protein